MALLDSLTTLDNRLFRNIVGLRLSENLFDDLVDDPAGQNAAMAADMRVRDYPPGIIERGLAYSQAIDYPFSSDKTVSSRYGDGTVRVWYGAFDHDTAMAESCWHALRNEMALIGVREVVIRHRAVYQVRAQGLFVDLRAKLADHPELIGEDYAPTQAIGKTVSGQGLPGLAYPSARWTHGECVAAFP